MRELEQNRDAVITIQGGGVFGLTVLGQLQAVIEKHRYTPLALAGTSAGAIVATLIWAGLTPQQIQNEFRRMIKTDPKALLGLLGPFQEPHFSFAAFCDLKQQVEGNLWTIGKGANRSVWNPIRWGAAANIWWKASKLKSRILPLFERRGFFPGDILERKIEELLRSAHDVPKDIIKSNEPLRFRHFADLMHDKKEDSYRPPLLLTATNLTRRRLEVISSFDNRYMNVPIAKAVRASAGFPVFFTPRDLPECPDGGWFVDGGVVSNFPVWAFSDAFRQKIQESPIYRHLASKPWIRIGLRVVEDVKKSPDLKDPGLFLRSLLAMLTGAARNELEEILSSMSSRSIVIKQPLAETDGPNGVLEIEKLDETKIDSMIAKGYAYADKVLTDRGVPGVYSATLKDEDIRKELKALISKCLLVLGRTQDAVKLRANIFVPIEQRMKLLFSYNMESDGDREMEFPDLESGLTGFCYTWRRPQICNLKKVADLREKNKDEYMNLFGMDPKTQGQVRADRTWLGSVPIFDPYELRFVAQTQLLPSAPAHKGGSYHGMGTEIDGAVLGVLNVDAGWEYSSMGMDPDPDMHFTDDRIQAILALMQSTAFSVARILSESFARGEAK